MVYQHVSYEGRSTPLPPGTYTAAELAARGVADNDITSLTVPPGWTVVLHDSADLTGASTAVTRNDTFLDGGWNDRASSIVVTAPPSRAGVTLYQHCNFTGYAVA